MPQRFWATATQGFSPSGCRAITRVVPSPSCIAYSSGRGRRSGSPIDVHGAFS